VLLLSDPSAGLRVCADRILAVNTKFRVGCIAAESTGLAVGLCFESVIETKPETEAQDYDYGSGDKT
jgi:hypothetical protein